MPVFPAAIADRHRIVVSEDFTALVAGPGISPSQLTEASAAQTVWHGFIDKSVAADTIE